MLPVDTGDGMPVFLLGVREAPSQPLRYLRIPADEQASMDGFMRLKAALADPNARAQAVQRYVAQATDAARPDLAEPFQQAAARVLALFAGTGTAQGQSAGGRRAVASVIQTPGPARHP